MSERKVINKYYPPDFDPSKIQKVKKNTKLKSNSTQQTVRLMTPFSMKCTKCDEYIHKSKKFNARKSVAPETYLDFKIYQFNIRCPRCNNTISFKTNPKNSNYVINYGAVKNYDSKEELDYKVETEEEILERLTKEQKEDEQFQISKEKRLKDRFYTAKSEEGTTLEQLEKQLLKEQQEQAIIDELENIRDRNRLLEIRKTEIGSTKLVSKDDGINDEEISQLFQNYRKTGITQMEEDSATESESINQNVLIGSKNNDGSGDNGIRTTTIKIKRKNVIPNHPVELKKTALVDYPSDSDSE